MVQNYLNFNHAIRLDAGPTWEAEEVWLDCLSRAVRSEKKKKTFDKIGIYSKWYEMNIVVGVVCMVMKELAGGNMNKM